MKTLQKIVCCVMFYGLLSSCYATSLSTLVTNNDIVVVADKSVGLLFVYNKSNNTLLSTPALYGKLRTTERDMQQYNVDNSIPITPTGTFTTHKFISDLLHEPITAIVEGKQSILAIHPVWLGNPDQQRVKRLHTPTPSDNRITNGCINVYPDFYYNIMYNIPDGTKVVVLPEEDELINDLTSLSIINM